MLQRINNTRQAPKAQRKMATCCNSAIFISVSSLSLSFRRSSAAAASVFLNRKLFQRWIWGLTSAAGAFCLGSNYNPNIAWDERINSSRIFDCVLKFSCGHMTLGRWESSRKYSLPFSTRNARASTWNNNLHRMPWAACRSKAGGDICHCRSRSATLPGLGSSLGETGRKIYK